MTYQHTRELQDEITRLWYDVDRLRWALEAALEVMEFAYMGAPDQPKEIELARAALAATEPKP